MVAGVEEKLKGQEEENRGNAELPHGLACESDRARFRLTSNLKVVCSVRRKEGCCCLCIYPCYFC